MEQSENNSSSAEPAGPLDFDPVEVEHRNGGWTAQRQRDFLEALADCGIVREAAARVNMTEQSAHRLRRRAGAESFGRAWEAALGFGYERLRSLAFERAVTGTVKKQYYRGEVVGENRTYDNRLLLYLLGKAEPAAPVEEGPCSAENWNAWLDAIEQGLDAPPELPDENGRGPVWRKDGEWWTRFPPPDGFNGRQDGRFGEPKYRRRCTIGEIEAIDAQRRDEEARQAKARDLYFARAGCISKPA